MSYKEKPQLKLYAYKNNSFVLQAIIDDYEECSFERNMYQAGQFSITINYNIPNASLFKRGLFVQFGNDKYDFGEIYTVVDSIGQDGKGSQKRVITGYDARFLLKRRVIANLNNGENWAMTAKGELCIRNLVKDQCGENAEEKRRLPITNIIPSESDALGQTYSVAETFSNLYEVCKTIATQSEIGWRMKFEGTLSLEFYTGNDVSDKVFFSTGFDSLSNGNFSDSTENYTNAVYIGGKGTGKERDIYLGEDSDDAEKIIVEGNDTHLVDEIGDSIVVDFLPPGGLSRFESWNSETEMNTENEYAAKANSILLQYMQNITVSGAGLAKCPYTYKKQYNVGDIIKLSFSGKSANVQIQSVTEHWAWNKYDLGFSFGKPENTLQSQIQLILRKIQQSSNKSSTISSVQWYTLPEDTKQNLSEVTCDTLGFTGEGGTFELYLDSEGTGSKNYNIYCKNLSGDVTLTAGGTDLTLTAGNRVTRIYVDRNGDIIQYT